MHNTPSPYQAPSPLSFKQQKLWSYVLYITAAIPLFAGSPILLPLFIWLYFKDENDLIAWHGKNVLNFTITWSLVALCVFVAIPALLALSLVQMLNMMLPFSLLGILSIPMLCLAINIFSFLAMLIAVIKLSKNQYWRLPLQYRFIK